MSSSLSPIIIRRIGRRHGYREVESPDSRKLLFEHENMLGCGGRESRFGRVQLEVDYEQRSVVSNLNHNRLGKTKLSRQVNSHNMLEEIFINPRLHTNRGRHLSPKESVLPSPPPPLVSPPSDSSGYNSMIQSPSSSPETPVLKDIKNLTKQTTVHVKPKLILPNDREGKKSCEEECSFKVAAVTSTEVSSSLVTNRVTSSPVLRPSLLSHSESSQLRADQVKAGSRPLCTKRVAFSSPIARSLSFDKDQGTSSLNNNTQNSTLRADLVSQPTRSILRSQALPSSSVLPSSLPSQFRDYRASVEDEEELGELSGKRKREDCQSLHTKKRVKKSLLTEWEEIQPTRSLRRLDLPPTPTTSADPVKAPPLRSHPTLESRRARRLTAQPAPAERRTFSSLLSGCILS